MENTTGTITEEPPRRTTEEPPSVIEHDQLKNLIITSIETWKLQKMKCGIDEVVNLVQDFL